MDGRPQRPPDRWEDRPAGDLLGAGPGEQDGHGHPQPPEVVRAGGRRGRARAGLRLLVCVYVWRLGVGPMGCQGGCHRVPGCAGVRVCVTMGLWQEWCPTRCLEGWRAWRDSGSFLGKGVIVPAPQPLGLGEGEMGWG